MSTGTEALASWRDGATKDAIFEFVRRTCGDGADAVPVEERIAVFDNDGTLWCEQPMPIQLDFILRDLVAAAEATPELRERQPWKAAYERDYALARCADGRALRRRRHQRAVLAAGILSAYARVSVEDFDTRAGRVSSHRSASDVRSAVPPVRVRADGRVARLSRGKRLHDLIVSGGGRDFMRPISQEVYGIPRER